MKDGLRVELVEDTDGDGRIDHRVWYAAGKPVRGQRDLAGDGVFEAAETWTDGALSRLSVDTDGNGRFDYGETFRPAARLWDYNEDGRDDSRETSDGKGGLVREFSTRADGRLRPQRAVPWRRSSWRCGSPDGPSRRRRTRSAA